MTQQPVNKIAFVHQCGAYTFTATYLDDGPKEALIEIAKDGAVVKSVHWPAYKIWNIQAHATDIVDDLEKGIRIAGETGFGGNVYDPQS